MTACLKTTVWWDIAWWLALSLIYNTDEFIFINVVLLSNHKAEYVSQIAFYVFSNEIVSFNLLYESMQWN